MTKDVFDAIKERRSISSFKPQEVPEASVNRLLEVGCRAPTAGNLQPWRFYAVKSAETRRGLTAASHNQNSMQQASVVIVVCAEPGKSAQRYGQRGRDLYCIQDTAAAVQNILLAATGIGLGACWIGAFDEAMAAESLGLEEGVRPVAMIPIGYPAGEGKEPARRPVEEVVFWV